MGLTLPILKSREVISLLRKVGFRDARQSGSHLVMRDPKTDKIVPIPIHPKPIKKGLLRKIIRLSGLTTEEFLKHR